MISTMLFLLRCSIFGMFLLAFSMATMANPPAQKISDDWYPPLKKGLWEIFNSESLYGGYTTTELRCVGEGGQEKRTSKKEHMEQTKDCHTTVLQTSAKKVEQRRECKKYEGVTSTIDVVFKGDFSSNFERMLTLSMSIPTRQEGATKLNRYRFVGMCPKGMLPGDTFTINSEGSVVGGFNRYTGRIKDMEIGVKSELIKRSRSVKSSTP
jgi:hypothetical protein